MTQATPTKAGHALLAVALGAMEAATDKNSWRNPNESIRQYLDQLAAWGYTLSDVETLITDPDSATPARTLRPPQETDAADEETARTRTRQPVTPTTRRTGRRT
jgi:ParB family chromosome partitioning protein